MSRGTFAHVRRQMSCRVVAKADAGAADASDFCELMLNFYDDDDVLWVAERTDRACARRSRVSWRDICPLPFILPLEKLPSRTSATLVRVMAWG